LVESLESIRCKIAQKLNFNHFFVINCVQSTH
jgi:hypothetical protein